MRRTSACLPCAGSAGASRLGGLASEHCLIGATDVGLVTCSFHGTGLDQLRSSLLLGITKGRTGSEIMKGLNMHGKALTNLHLVLLMAKAK